MSESQPKKSPAKIHSQVSHIKISPPKQVLKKIEIKQPTCSKFYRLRERKPAVKLVTDTKSKKDSKSHGYKSSQASKTSKNSPKLPSQQIKPSSKTIKKDI